jgi:hypothetical protein
MRNRHSRIPSDRVGMNIGSVFRTGGFDETSIGAAAKYGGQDIPLKRRVVAVNGAGFVTVPRIMVSGDLLSRHCTGNGAKARGLLEADSFMQGIRGELKAALGKLGHMPVLVRPSTQFETLSAPLFGYGTYPSAANQGAIEQAVCRTFLSAFSENGEKQVDVIIQPLFGMLIEARSYGRLYGPVLSGRATLGDKVSTTLGVGFDTGSGASATADAGEVRPVKDILGPVRQSHFLQMREGDNAMNIASLSYRPEHLCLEESPAWLFEKLARLKVFLGNDAEVEWAVDGSNAGRLTAALRMAEPQAMEVSSTRILGGTFESWARNMECTGLVVEYALSRDSIRELDSGMSGYVLVSGVSNIVNSAITATDIPNASAIVIIRNIPETAHKAEPFAREAAAAGKTVIWTDKTVQNPDDIPGQDSSHAGYIVSNCGISIRAMGSHASISAS